MSEQQKFLLWQYAELVHRIEVAGQQQESQELLELIEVMNAEKERMEDAYEVLYGERPVLPPPPPPPWW